MTHQPPSTQEFKRWKQRYHPSDIVSMLGNEVNGFSVIYVADSDGGSGDERPFAVVDLGEGYYS